MQFCSPTKGIMSLDKVVTDLLCFVLEQPQAAYKLIIGTDSQTTNSSTHFVSAIVVHRVGKGGRYYVRHFYREPIRSLRQKLTYETSMSLEVTMLLKDRLLRANLLPKFEMEIHVDAGNAGDTRELIKDLIGMVVANGITPRIKPESFGASKVADRYTK